MMARRYFFHIDLEDLYDDRRLVLSAGDQADALRHDEEWSALYLDGEHRGRLRTVRVSQQRADLVAELRDPHRQLPPYLQISRVRIDRSQQEGLARFTVMVRPRVDRTEDF
jgi:hypothetical protein